MFGKKNSKVSLEKLKQKAQWLELAETGIIKPYVYLRPENQIKRPGHLHKCDWFPWAPINLNPLDLDNLEFAEQILHLENTAFGPQAMPIPRWVFYDCGVLPGFVAGFAMKTSHLPEGIKKVMRHDPSKEWTPLSLFIMIPSMMPGEWIAHNLCAINSLVGESDRMYGLGFLSKAFGLWYANVVTCCGVTQWGNPALKLHAHFGHLQVVTSFTPVHSHAHSVTYRSQVDTAVWSLFFSKEKDLQFLSKYKDTSNVVDPKNNQTMIDLHQKIIAGQGPFFLSPFDLAEKKLTEPLIVYQPI